MFLCTAFIKLILLQSCKDRCRELHQVVATKQKCLLVTCSEVDTSQHSQSTYCNVSDMNAADRKEWLDAIANILPGNNSETLLQHFSA